jgi:HD-like signal output (HDOD) protein
MLCDVALRTRARSVHTPVNAFSASHKTYSQECEHGTQECVRHVREISQSFAVASDKPIVIATVPAEYLRERALRTLSQLPPFSPILNRVLASLASEDVSFIALAELIEKDTVLAGNTLRLVNSALYGRRATVNSVRHAISLLGVNKLRNATLGMSVTRLWNQVRTPPGWSMAKFNLHAVATAMLADMLSQEVPVEYAEGAFAAGLFHDLGRLLIAIGLPDEYGQVTRMHAAAGGPRWKCEKTVLGFTHAELSSDALEQWNLPEEIRVAVRYHDTPEMAPGLGGLSLSTVIHAANEYVSAIGYHMDDGPPPAVDTATLCLQELKPRRDLPELLEAFAAEFEAVRTLF